MIHHVFVWTLSDLIGVIVIGIALLFFLAVAALIAWDKAVKWVRKK